MYRKRGFTLIELLVVIAIIALLLAILMPALGRVKKSAQSVICRTNLHQWYIAGNLYTQNNAGKFWHGWGGTGHNSNWWMAAMRTYYGNIGKIRVCPTAKKVVKLMSGAPGPGVAMQPFAAWGFDPGFFGILDPLYTDDYGSYAANGWLENFKDKPQAMQDALTSSNPKFFGSTTRMKRPAIVPFMLDAQWIDAWPEPYTRPPRTENEQWQSGTHFTRVCQNRHMQKENVVFMDGVARTVGLKELWTLKWHMQYDTKGVWTIDGGATRSQWVTGAEWMANFKDY